MKPLALFLASGLWLLASGFCLAADIALQDGRTFKDATILSQSAAYVSIRHAAGLTSVPKAQLPAELLAQYPIQKPAAKRQMSATSGQKPAVRSQRPEAIFDIDQLSRTVPTVTESASAEVSVSSPATVTEHDSAEMVSGAVCVKPLTTTLHEVTYRVESRTPGTRITITFPEAPRDPSLPPIKTVKRKNFTPPPPTPGRKSFVMQADGYGAWSETITAPDGFNAFLRVGELGTNPNTARFAQDATLIMLVDGTEVRRERLEPRKGSLEMTWTLGLPDADQPAIVRSGDKSNDSEGWVVSPDGRSRSKIISRDPGFVDTRDQ